MHLAKGVVYPYTPQLIPAPAEIPLPDFGSASDFIFDLVTDKSLLQFCIVIKSVLLMKKKISQKVEMDKDLTSIQGSAVFISTSLYILFSQLAIIIAAVKIVGIMFNPSPYAI